MRVSIIMPAYNAADYIQFSITSVLAQTYSDWELLIVDDASTDNTLELARSHAENDPRITVLAHSVNRGVAAARNLALEEAGGRYIAFLDSDDLWVARKLELQVAFMEENNVLVSYGDYQRMDEQGRDLNLVRPPGEITWQKLLHSNTIGNLTGMYNAEVLGKQPFLQCGHEDYIAWLTLVKKAGKACSVGKKLGYYRVLRGSTSANKLRTLRWQWNIYRNVIGLSRCRSTLLMLSYICNGLLKRI